MLSHKTKRKEPRISKSVNKIVYERKRSIINLFPCIIPTRGNSSPKIVKSNEEMNNAKTSEEGSICHELSNNNFNENIIDFSSTCRIFEKPSNKMKRLNN